MAEAKKTSTKKPASKKADEKAVKTAEKAAVSTTTEIVDALVEAEAIAEVAEEAKAVVKAADEKTTTTKAGKRSAKSLKEAEAKEAKEARKAAAKDEADATSKPKVQQKLPRTRLERRSKAYKKSFELIDKNKQYDLKEALDLITKTSTVKFDASVELHIRLGVDPRQADQNIRGTVVLPSGSGKTLRVAVFAEDADVAKAKKAGADIAGGEEFLQQLDKGELNFDTLIATPTVMAKLSKYARVLGPKGLMPNPKSGTVTANVEKAITEAKAGKVEYRVDTTGIIHVSIGKVSFGADKLVPNAQAVIDSIKAQKPASVKGNYVISTFVASTMGPSVAVSAS